MPRPIMPIHKLESLDGIFDPQTYEGAGISDIQNFFLNESSERKASAIKYDDKILNMLETIDKSEDELVTTASSLVSNNKMSEKIYSVPRNIPDNDLLHLKTLGLVTGSGRSVKITEKGVVALRTKWLSEPNTLKTNCAKENFDYQNASSFRRVSSKNNKFTRTAEKDNEFDLDERMTIQQAKKLSLDNIGRLPRIGREVVVEEGVEPFTYKNLKGNIVTVSAPFKTYLQNNSGRYRVWTYRDLSKIIG